MDKSSWMELIGGTWLWVGLACIELGGQEKQYYGYIIMSCIVRNTHIYITNDYAFVRLHLRHDYALCMIIPY